MASVTLAESAKLSQDMLVAGVIENIITVNPFYEVLPFAGIEGNSLAYNRENALGAAQWTTVGTAIAGGKAPATFTQVTTSLTTLVGDAEVNGLIQATRSDINNQKAVQVASKAKELGRQYASKMIVGVGANNELDGLINLVPAGQKVASAANGSVLTLEKMDECMDKVVDKDGEVDYIMMNSRTIRSYMALLRALGGASINETVTLPSGRQLPAYRGVPIYRNDYIPVNVTQGNIATATVVLMGTLDDGSMMHGISGLTASGSAGIQIEEAGISETKDETITRVKWYNGLALFSNLGIASMTGISN
jgi:hypothetical protein